jgi:hypothetical protein
VGVVLPLIFTFIVINLKQLQHLFMHHDSIMHTQSSRAPFAKRHHDCYPQNKWPSSNWELTPNNMVRQHIQNPHQTPS